MGLPSCSLSFFVARTDVEFMLNTIPNIVRMSNYPFTERVLAVDTAPLSGDKVMRPGIGTMEQLRECTQQLLHKGVVDRVVDINYSPAYRSKIYHKHFGSPIRATHNYKGYPILGSIFAIEECQSEYVVHFDSDMMMYQDPDYSWVQEGIELMKKHSNLMFLRPRSGPPREDGRIIEGEPYAEHPDGFYQYHFFGSRVYLLNRQRFSKLLPLPIIWRPYIQKFMDYLPVTLKTLSNNITGKGKLESWEVMVSKKLEKTDYFRGTLTNCKAWTLHPIDRSSAFIQALPSIIKRIEAGEYPLEQAGYYDLIPNLWY